MSNSFPGSSSNSPFGSNFDIGALGQNVFDAFDKLKTQFEHKVDQTFSSRAGRGDVRAAVLALLAEKPMHGYQIIQEIGERSGGSWKPSAGSVYPTLQLLADEGLIAAEEAGGRKTYSLTEAGRAAAAESSGSLPWESTGFRENASRHTALPKAGVELAQAAAQVARSGSPEQVQQAVELIDETRRKLYALLAQA